jgi:hypothetical protein
MRSFPRIFSGSQMRTTFIALLASTILTGCRKGDTNSVGSPHDTLPSATPSTPPAVLQLADDYLASHSGKQTDKRGSVKEQFLHGFFEGFTMPNMDIDVPEAYSGDATPRGMKAGQEYRRANPTKLKETMEGFGYTEIEIAGVYTRGFEYSDFRPDTQPGQTWWLSSCGDARSYLPKDEKISDEGVHIRVRGYLSPSGKYGHVGGYSRELLATKIGH